MQERDGGGEFGDEHLAPVIPLFGGSRAVDGSEPADPAERQAAPGELAERVVRSIRDAGHDLDAPTIPRRTGENGLWRSTWDEQDDDPDDSPSARHPAYGARGGRQQSRRLRAVGPHEAQPRMAPSQQAAPGGRAQAEEVLVRRLRVRQLSVSEARGVLRDAGLVGAETDEVIDEFLARRYLDDRALADHLVTAGVQRKGQGRVALARALAQRGIPRDVIDDALADLPDDDAERALEFARTKAASMARLEPETALRRLVGQLSRRGYTGAVAMNAARAALREAPGASSGVRFVDSD